MPRKLESRIAKIEQVLTKRSRPDCICANRVVAIPGREEEFEAEMNRICPVHGERRLPDFMLTRIVGSNGLCPPTPKLDLLVEEYERRRARQRKEMLEDDFGEL